MKRLILSMMVCCCLLATSVAAWCGDNGTVTVNGLVWLKDAGCLGEMRWDAAMARAKTLADGQCGLSDKSKPGDWRLPTVDELKAIYASKSQFKNVKAYGYWSSSTVAGHSTFAWLVSMGNGHMYNYFKGTNVYVWPVRSGQ
ncbi:MAG: DUF1566 domain-containing protein [Trichlorobacter sp.]|uniref:Lcl C-terminal domain-containing protein n=1 Tax=Trichlorobacter sp. TaxID=2911007 RepID=UPI00256C74BF|nr:DUF1566 domain-containing protein [Trichlorobacter sp.]MDK9717417.1 DUF1566 domain-containing protein [Trichlorobacter sp.]